MYIEKRVYSHTGSTVPHIRNKSGNIYSPLMSPGMKELPLPLFLQNGVFSVRNSEIFVDDVSLKEIGEDFGTPLFVYSKSSIVNQWNSYVSAVPSDSSVSFCYAVKANSSSALLEILVDLGAGFDIVSVGELFRVLDAGAQPSSIVFSGVGKREDEIYAALEAGIRCLNIESEHELLQIDRIAGSMGVTAPISLRVNPNVEAPTHRYISTGQKKHKFGIDLYRAFDVYLKASRLENLEILGIDCHIGSQILTIEPFLESLGRVMGLLDRLREEAGIVISHVDMGGGIGIPHSSADPNVDPGELVRVLCEKMSQRTGPKFELVLEPGRSLIGNAGVLLSQVLLLKGEEELSKKFCVVDAAMTDLIRPCLYGAHHEILPVSLASSDANTSSGAEQERDECESEHQPVYDVVGPVCETGDFLGLDRSLSVSVGDFVAIFSAGAYASAMSSRYNSRPFIREVLVSSDSVSVIRQQEPLPALKAAECSGRARDCSISFAKHRLLERNVICVPQSIQPTAEVIRFLCQSIGGDCVISFPCESRGDIPFCVWNSDGRVVDELHCAISLLLFLRENGHVFGKKLSCRMEMDEKRTETCARTHSLKSHFTVEMGMPVVKESLSQDVEVTVDDTELALTLDVVCLLSPSVVVFDDVSDDVKPNVASRVASSDTFTLPSESSDLLIVFARKVSRSSVEIDVFLGGNRARNRDFPRAGCAVLAAGVRKNYLEENVHIVSSNCPDLSFDVSWEDSEAPVLLTASCSSSMCGSIVVPRDSLENHGKNA